MSRVWQGIALPWGKDVSSFVELKDDVDILKTSVLFIIMTRKGERVMLPEFGSEVPDAIFEQNDAVLVGMIQDSVREALARWDDRVAVVDVLTEAVENTLNIKILFRNAKDPLAGGTHVVAFGLPVTVAG